VGYLLAFPAQARPKSPAEVRLVPWWTASDYPGEAEIEEAIFRETNRQRVQAGRSPLQADVALQVAARQHSLEMLELGYFEHISPRREWAEPFQRAYLAGCWEAQIGENIAKNRSNQARTAAEIVGTFMEGWMESPKHRENILRPEFTHLGVGVVQRHGWYCGTQVFASRYYQIERASLRQVTEKMVCVRFKVATSAPQIHVWVNQCLRHEVKAQVPGPTVLELAFPRRGGKQEIWLAVEGKVYFTASLNPSRSLKKALTAQPRGPALQVLQTDLWEEERTHYLFSGQARLLRPVNKVRLFLDESHWENLFPNKQEEITWAVRLPKASGRHRIGLFPDQWKKYLFFVDTDQPLERAFVPRFSPD
jgi:uncharacterized protein YkwD